MIKELKLELEYGFEVHLMPEDRADEYSAVVRQHGSYIDTINGTVPEFVLHACLDTIERESKAGGFEYRPQLNTYDIK